jgi:riboflavin kinase/FMN adenylyltransferase
MRVVAGVEALTAAEGRLFVAVGVFDGLHLGHAYLLRALVAEAARRHARPAVITFDHHPDEVLTGHAPPLLLDADERLARLAACGVGITVVQHFDEALRRTTYDAFVRRITERVELAGFLMTPDAAFGHERRGTAPALAALGASWQPPFEVVVVPPFELDGRQVRSSDIRAAVAAGDLGAAARMLGRPYAVVGRAIASERSWIIEPDLPMALPPDGRYPVAVGPADTLPDGGSESVASTVAVIGADGSTVGELPGVSPGSSVRLTFGGLDRT